MRSKVITSEFILNCALRELNKPNGFAGKLVQINTDQGEEVFVQFRETGQPEIEFLGALGTFFSFDEEQGGIENFFICFPGWIGEQQPDCESLLLVHGGRERDLMIIQWNVARDSSGKAIDLSDVLFEFLHDSNALNLCRKSFPFGIQRANQIIQRAKNNKDRYIILGM